MLKLMIVDDEAYVRDGIRQAIDWKQDGVEVAAEAGDGQAALEKALQIHPDIILCDIRMPKLDGVAFARQLKTMLPDVRIIMLTAYAEREYMLEAIRCGISDFLLKPAGLDQIRQTVLKVRDAVLEERSRRTLQQQRDALLEENESLFHDHYISALLDERLPAEKVREAARLLHIPLDGPYYAILLFAPEQQWAGVQLLCGILAQWTPVIAQMDEHMVMVLSLTMREDHRALASALRAKGSDLRACHRGALLLTNPVETLGALSAAYAEASQTFPRCIWLANGSLETMGAPTLPPLAPDAPQAVLEQLYHQAGLSGQAGRAAETCYDALQALKLPPRQFSDCMEDIASHVRLQSGTALEGMTGLVSREHFVAQLERWSPESADLGSGHTGRALRFLRAHYAENIQLEDVAKALFLSPTYVSRILNDQGDRGFVGWLRFFRIQQAQRLMTTTSLKNYEISEQVGYHSYKVFAEHFLKETGQTISAWRKSARAQNDSLMCEQEDS